eukprot:c13316_g1_i1.p1 GENE.c13316_g1_i1~~c13316_g1_i1.p1  ORF type:complete len:606 (-),score=144.21 c13316_g1_i1:80-1897(-)
MSMSMSMPAPPTESSRAASGSTHMAGDHDWHSESSHTGPTLSPTTSSLHSTQHDDEDMDRSRVSCDVLLLNHGPSSQPTVARSLASEALERVRLTRSLDALRVSLANEKRARVLELWAVRFGTLKLARAFHAWQNLVGCTDSEQLQSSLAEKDELIAQLQGHNSALVSENETLFIRTQTAQEKLHKLEGLLLRLQSGMQSLTDTSSQFHANPQVDIEGENMQADSQFTQDSQSQYTQDHLYAQDSQYQSPQDTQNLQVSQCPQYTQDHLYAQDSQYAQNPQYSQNYQDPLYLQYLESVSPDSQYQQMSQDLQYHDLAHPQQQVLQQDAEYPHTHNLQSPPAQNDNQSYADSAAVLSSNVDSSQPQYPNYTYDSYAAPPLSDTDFFGDESFFHQVPVEHESTMTTAESAFNPLQDTLRPSDLASPPPVPGPETHVADNVHVEETQATVDSEAFASASVALLSRERVATEPDTESLQAVQQPEATNIEPEDQDSATTTMPEEPNHIDEPLQTNQVPDKVTGKLRNRSQRSESTDKTKKQATNEDDAPNNLDTSVEPATRPSPVEPTAKARQGSAVLAVVTPLVMLGAAIAMSMSNRGLDFLGLSLGN